MRAYDLTVSGSLVVSGSISNADGTFILSGSTAGTSASLSSRITTAESELGNTLISGSAQIASNISGSFTSVSSSLASRLTSEEGEAEGSVVSSSAQIAADISGSLGANATLIRGLTTAKISGSFNKSAVSASFALKSTISG